MWSSTVQRGYSVRHTSRGYDPPLSLVCMYARVCVYVFFIDAATALRVMTLLKGVASRGTTILCSLHQPRPRVLNLLDKVSRWTSWWPCMVFWSGGGGGGSARLGGGQKAEEDVQQLGV